MSREEWDARAQTYNQLNWVHDGSLLADAVDSVVSLAPDSVLEIGCGTGALTRELAKVFGTRLTACDISPEMLKRCRETLGDHAGLVTLTDEPQDTYDVVVARMVLRHQTYPRSVLQEWSQYLRPFGSFVIIEGPPPIDDPSAESHRLYQQVMALKHGRWKPSVTPSLLSAWAADLWRAPRVIHRETYTEDNSIRNWAEGGGCGPALTEQILQMHRDAPQVAMREFRRAYTDKSDVRLRWRHVISTITPKPRE